MSPAPIRPARLGDAAAVVPLVHALNLHQGDPQQAGAADIAVAFLGPRARGVLPVAEFARMMEAPILGLPTVGDLGWSFDAALIIPFAVAAMAACLKTVGDLTTAQRLNDADWVRPDLQGISRGTLYRKITEFGLEPQARPSFRKFRRTGT